MNTICSILWSILLWQLGPLSFSLLIGSSIRFHFRYWSKLITKQSLQKVPDSDSDRPAVQVGFQNGAIQYSYLIGPFLSEHHFEIHS